MPAGDKNIIASAIEFWEKLYETTGEAVVKFTKKDRTVRIMKCTLDFTKIPKAQHPKKVNMAKIIRLMQNSGIIHVYDLEKKDWRSVPFQSADWLKIDDKQYKIRPFSGGKQNENVVPFKGKKEGD